MTRQRLIWAVAAVVVILRLYLAGDRDILALNSPHDEYWYIKNAFDGVWGGRYDEMTLIHLPIYSVWLALLDLLGLPARLAIDAAWLAASGYLAVAIARLTRVSWAGLVLFAFLAFHPHVIRIFDRALAETLLTVLVPAVLASGIELWRLRDEANSTERSIALMVYVVGFALAYHTRTEGVLMLVPLVLLGILSLHDRRTWWGRRDGLKLSVAMIALPLAATLLVGGALSAANYAKWGIWASQELAAPGYKNAMTALASIDAGRTPKQITVTREMMAMGFKESPTFRELQPAMDGDVGNAWVALSAPYVARPGEIGNGWFYWALRDFAAKAGWHSDARLAESKYAAMAKELNRAFDDGRLKKRRMFSAFVDPDVAKWLPDVPRSLIAVTRLLVQPRHEHIDSPAENAAPRQLDQYTAVTGRRQPAPRLSIGGWVIVPPEGSVGMQFADGRVSWQSVGPARADVPGAHAFTLSAQASPSVVSLGVKTSGTPGGSISVASLVAGRTAILSDGSVVGIDSLEVNQVSKRAESLLPGLATLYVWTSRLLCLFVGVAIVLLVARRRFEVIAALILLSMTAVVARAGLLAILDASSWNGAQPRYIMPAISSFACAGILSLVVLLDEAKFLNRKIRGRKVKH
jgi:hypothetical protein